MISRRRFLEVGGITAGAALASRPLAASANDKSNDSLPPSIAGFNSRKSEAAPITRE